MRAYKATNLFVRRHPRIGPILWILSIQYFVVQVVVASNWVIPYSISQNTISDLGNTVCGSYRSMYVCSPLHEAMNLSFVLLGLSMALGALFLSYRFKRSIGNVLGLSLMALGGVGTILVGSYPENTSAHLHILGAALPFLWGNISLLILAYSLKLPKSLRVYTFISGAIALIALILLVTQTYIRIGIGGIERIVAYPQTVWLIIIGFYILLGIKTDSAKM